MRCAATIDAVICAPNAPIVRMIVHPGCPHRCAPAGLRRRRSGSPSTRRQSRSRSRAAPTRRRSASARCAPPQGNRSSMRSPACRSEAGTNRHAFQAPRRSARPPTSRPLMASRTRRPAGDGRREPVAGLRRGLNELWNQQERPEHPGTPQAGSTRFVVHTGCWRRSRMSTSGSAARSSYHAQNAREP